MSYLALPKPAPREKRPPQRIARGKRPRRQRKTSLAALKRRLWCLFAAYVRERDGNRCVTCGGLGDQAGHFFSRRLASVWVDPKNVGCQCARCNLFLHGNPGAFADYIVRTYGPREMVRLIHRANNITKHWRADELRALIGALQRGGADFEALYYEANL